MNLRPVFSILSIISIVLLFNQPIYGQQEQAKKTVRKISSPKSKTIGMVYGGIGGGLDFGGFGCRLEFLPVKWVSAFGGLGYNLVGIGYNAGISLKLLPGHNITPVIMGMYGYNGVLVIKNQFGGIERNETYYGLSAGGGLEFNMGKHRRNKLSVEIIYPFRNGDFKKDVETTHANVLPITFSLGFSFGM